MARNKVEKPSTALKETHFVGSLLTPGWGKVISGELRLKAGVKVVTQKSKRKTHV